MKTCLAIAFVLGVMIVHAQPEKKSVVIGSMITKPNALLIINPPNSDQGVLLPQLTSLQRMNLKPSSPTEDGLIVFDTGDQSYFYWSNGAWVKLLNDRDRQIRFHSIDPAAFAELKSNDHTRHSNIIIFQSDNTFVTAIGDFPQEIIAPLDIPHGAVIKELVVYYMDNDRGDINIRLLRKGFSGPSGEMLSWNSSGSSDAVKTQSFENFNGMESIDVENYSYRVIVRFDMDEDDELDDPSDAKQRIYGVRIKYEH